MSDPQFISLVVIFVVLIGAMVPHLPWIAQRLPHIQSQFSLDRHPFFSCFRIYGLQPYFRLCLFDWTKTAKGTRVKLFRLTLFSTL